MSVDAVVSEMDGAVALPRANGELTFAAPWESRAFAMAVALYEQGLYDWSLFRDRLVEQIAAHGEDDGTRYYLRWLEAFEAVLRETDVVLSSELEARARVIEAADDHAHEHHHQHD